MHKISIVEQELIIDSGNHRDVSDRISSEPVLFVNEMHTVLYFALVSNQLPRLYKK